MSVDSDESISRPLGIETIQEFRLSDFGILAVLLGGCGPVDRALGHYFPQIS